MPETARPILIYDDLCYSCMKFAAVANALVRGKAVVVGHYSRRGIDLKKSLFPKGYEGLEMFWFIIDGHAYGGRAGLFRLLRYIFLSPKKSGYERNEFKFADCRNDCMTTKGVFLRSCSIITRHKKFEVPAGINSLQ